MTLAADTAASPLLAPADLARATGPVPQQRREVGPAQVTSRTMGPVETWLRLGIGLAWIALCSCVFVVALFVLLPSRAARVKVGNIYGSVVGRVGALLTGSRFVILGEEHADARRPSIYVCNHTSALDLLLGVWMSRIGTCGVAKKEILYVPFFGQFFWLAGHLTLDRANNSRAVAALKNLARFVLDNGLSIYIWPEGTRSKDGRLLPFKRGAFHFALATRLPIVPIVIRGSHRAWPNKTFKLSPTTVEIEFLPPIDTSHWQPESLDAHIAALREVYVQALPEDQKPLPAAVDQAPRPAA